jgi:hypothetical protein
VNNFNVDSLEYDVTGSTGVVQVIALEFVSDEPDHARVGVAHVRVNVRCRKTT